jgi:phytoene synthase
VEQVRILRPTVPPEGSPAFRLLSLVEPYLAQMDRRDYDPLATPVELPQWRRIWALWRGKF